MADKLNSLDSWLHQEPTTTADGALWIDLTYIFVNDAIVVRVLITGVTHPVSVRVLLPRVWNKYAVVLETTQHTSSQAVRSKACGDSGWKQYLLAGFVSAMGILVRISINICILTTLIAIARPPNATLTHTHTHKQSKMKVNVECCSWEILFYIHTTQLMLPSLSRTHSALAPQGLGCPLGQGLAFWQPLVWSPVKPVLQSPQRKEPW